MEVSEKEECLDECHLNEYVATVTTTQLSLAFITYLNYLNSFTYTTETAEFVSFTVYYRTFDNTVIAYHGKVWYIW